MLKQIKSAETSLFRCLYCNAVNWCVKSISWAWLDGSLCSIIAADGATNIGVVGGPVSGLQKVLARVSNWQLSRIQVCSDHEITFLGKLLVLTVAKYSSTSTLLGHHQIWTHFSLEAWAVSQAILDKAIGWTCGQDCSYSCMWRTVEVYGQHGRFESFKHDDDRSWSLVG